MKKSISLLNILLHSLIFFSEFIKKEAERNKSQPRPFFRIELRATTDKENHFPGFVLCAPYSLVKEWIRAYSLKLSVWLELERLRFNLSTLLYDSRACLFGRSGYYFCRRDKSSGANPQKRD